MILCIIELSYSYFINFFLALFTSKETCLLSCFPFSLLSELEQPVDEACLEKIAMYCHVYRVVWIRLGLHTLVTPF